MIICILYESTLPTLATVYFVCGLRSCCCNFCRAFVYAWNNAQHNIYILIAVKFKYHLHFFLPLFLPACSSGIFLAGRYAISITPTYVKNVNLRFSLWPAIVKSGVRSYLFYLLQQYNDDDDADADLYINIQDVVTSLRDKLCVSADEYFSLVLEHVKSLKRNKLTILDPQETLARVSIILFLYSTIYICLRMYSASFECLVPQPDITFIPLFGWRQILVKIYFICKY